MDIPFYKKKRNCVKKVERDIIGSRGRRSVNVYCRWKNVTHLFGEIRNRIWDDLCSVWDDVDRVCVTECFWGWQDFI